MTATEPVPAPIPADWANTPTWCSTCEVHQATSSRPECPVCLDKRKREAS